MKLVRAGAPEREHDPKICAVHEPVAVDVSTRECRAGWAPEGEQYAKVGAIDNSIQIEIDVMARWTFADVGDAVGVGVGELTIEDLAVVDDVVVVAVGGPFDDIGPNGSVMLL